MSLRADVCAVIVTYGNRFHLVRRVIEAVLQNGVKKVVVVDNGMLPECSACLDALMGDSGAVINVVSLPENRGSAGGYKAGLEYAIRCTVCEYIWFLDDDNVPDDGALAALLEQYQELGKTFSRDALALLSLREDREYLRDIANGAHVADVFPRHSSFMGFHLCDVPRKLIRRIHIRRNDEMPSAGQVVARIPYGPYGGLFFHRSVVSCIGYPDERFFVYADDTEFTYRITRNGGALYLVASSLIRDAEPRWNKRSKGNTSFSRLLLADDGFRVYYAMRNRVYFDLHSWAENHGWYQMNKWIYLSILGLLAILFARLERFALVRRAVREGERGDLGYKNIGQLP
jgi:GT2 family glycosyltransferase